MIISLIVAAAMVMIHMIVIVGALISLAREPGSPRAERRGAAEDPNAGPHEQATRGALATSVDVLIPARDEETLLPRLLESLRAQTTNDFGIVLVNDRSSDATPRIMDEFAASLPGRVRVVTLTDDPTDGNPKQRALAAGSAQVTADVILMTDADCLVPPDWVRTMAEPFGDERVGLVFGPVIPGTEGTGRRMGFLDRFQSFDQVFRFQYTAGAAGFGAPSGGFGNNLAVRGRALADAGGFEGLRYSTTEDAQLICQVRETDQWKIRALRRAGARVVPATEPRMSPMVRQSIRWNTGGLFAPDPTARLSYGVVMLYLFASVLLTPAGLFLPPLLLPAAGSFTSMLFLGILAGVLNGRGLWYWLLLPVNLVFAMLFYSYVTLLTLVKVPVSWKGRRLGGVPH